jgi:RNA polymerase sigma-70 factor (ECF subfamily)
MELCLHSGGPTAPHADPLRAFVAELSTGDEAALGSIYDATCRRVFGLALRIVRDRLAAEEVVHEVYAQVWRQADRYDAAKGTVATWLLTLTRSRAIDVLRTRERLQGRFESLPDSLELCDSSPDPEQRSEERERAPSVRQALKRLPREQRQVLEAAFFDGLSHSEVARALGAPLGTVKTRIRTGLEAIRRALEPAKEGLA